MTGELIKIYLCREKGSARKSVSQANLDYRHGLIGDYKSESGDKDRQLLILLDIDRENINSNYLDKGLCTRRFQENILIKGLNLNQLSVYTSFKIGKSKIEITSVGKKCFKECELVKSEEECPLKERVLFAKVLESGIIKVGDKIVKE